MSRAPLPLGFGWRATARRTMRSSDGAGAAPTSTVGGERSACVASSGLCGVGGVSGACPSVGVSPTISAHSVSAAVATAASTSAAAGVVLALRRQMSSSTCASSAARSSSARCASHAASGAAAPAPGCVVAESTSVMLRPSLICCAISSSAAITPASSGLPKSGTTSSGSGKVRPSAAGSVSACGARPSSAGGVRRRAFRARPRQARDACGTCQMRCSPALPRCIFSPTSMHHPTGLPCV